MSDRVYETLTWMILAPEVEGFQPHSFTMLVCPDCGSYVDPTKTGRHDEFHLKALA